MESLERQRSSIRHDLNDKLDTLERLFTSELAARLSEREPPHSKICECYLD